MNTIHKCGNEALLERRKTAFLCSRNASVEVEKAVDEWLDTLKAEVDCVMCGNQSSMERRVFEGLLRRKIPTILMLAEALPDTWSKEMQAAMQAGRLLAVTHCDESVHWASARSANDRNLLMIGLAAEVVVGCCTEGGNLSRQLMQARNVRYLFKTASATYQPKSSGYGMAAEPKPEYPKAAPQQWKRRMWSVNKAVTIEQGGTDREACFRIWQVKDADLQDSVGSKIVLSPRELIDLHEALGEVIIQISDKRLSDVRSMAVQSASGRVTFDFKLLTDDGLLIITQRTETRFMGERRSPVMLNAREIREFYGIVTEAAERARKMLNVER